MAEIKTIKCNSCQNNSVCVLRWKNTDRVEINDCRGYTETKQNTGCKNCIYIGYTRVDGFCGDWNEPVCKHPENIKKDFSAKNGQTEHYEYIEHFNGDGFCAKFKHKESSSFHRNLIDWIRSVR